MEKEKIKELIKSFNAMLSTKETLKTYENYYSALVSWVNSREELKGKVEKDEVLSVLLKLNPHGNIIEEPDISLEMEKQRLGGLEYESIEEMLMIIRDTLRDLTAVQTGKYCPICFDGGLRYVMAENEHTNGKELIRECDICIWTEHLDGREWTEGKAKIYPVNSEDIERYLAKM